MADDDLQGGPSPFTAQSVYPADTGATNPELAAMFLREHRGAMQQRQPQIDDVFNKMTLNTESMTKMLDDTTAAIKASRGGGAGGVNVPLMAMASGLLSSRGNFGEQLGAGFGRMAPAIQAQRDDETAMHTNLAQIGLRRAGLENVPLEAKLSYMKAMQTGDLAAARGIEQALIRAQAKGAGSGDSKAAQLKQKTIKDALEEARKQVVSMGTEHYATAEERESDIERRFLQNIQYQGLKPDDPEIQRFREIMQQRPPTAMQQRKSFFDAPTSPEALDKVRERGLPPPPTNYAYDPATFGQKERMETLKKEGESFRKEAKDWDTQIVQQRKTLADLETMERILDKNPTVVGKNVGIIPNEPFGFGMNITKDAQVLSSKMKDIQVHNFPQDQGAVSNAERVLFAEAGPSMEYTAGANKELIGIGKEIIKRDVDRRAFFTEYFNDYKTTDGMVAAWDRYIHSPAGSSFTYDKAGNPVANKSRQNWREYFKSEWKEPTKRADGGYIKLGDEWD